MFNVPLISAAASVDFLLFELKILMNLSFFCVYVTVFLMTRETKEVSIINRFASVSLRGFASEDYVYSSMLLLEG